MKLMLFSVEDANRMLPELKPLLWHLMRIKGEFDRLSRRVDALSLAVAGAAPENPDALELKLLTAQRDALGREIAKGVQGIQRRGPVVKDIDRGLVDFYALSGDRLVFLCWKLGESEVGHWHTLDGGFASRQPLKPAERD